MTIVLVAQMLLLTLVKAVPTKEKKNWSELKSEWEEMREVD